MVVLDCSAAMAMLQRNPIGCGLRSLMLEGEKVVAPSVFKDELGNAVWRNVRGGLLREEDCENAISAGLALVGEFADDAELVVEATHEALHYNHPVYDMLYLVLTRRNGATLFTLDRKLAEACCKAGVNCVELVDWPA